MLFLDVCNFVEYYHIYKKNKAFTQYCSFSTKVEEVGGKVVQSGGKVVVGQLICQMYFLYQLDINNQR